MGLSRCPGPRLRGWIPNTLQIEQFQIAATSRAGVPSIHACPLAPRDRGNLARGGALALACGVLAPIK